MIYFIGAGPGAADLITVKGKELLEKADLVIYAGSLVNPELLKYCKPECTIMNSATMTLEEVIAAMVPAAQAGQLVVRLHTGDPSVYGAHREQIDLLRSYNLDYEVVPGVSSFCTADQRLLPDFPQRFADSVGKIEKRLDCASKGDFCICLYNPSSHKRHDYLQKACDIMLKNQPGTIPAGIVRNIGRDGQDFELTTLAELRDKQVDMFSTVIIGNTQTEVINGRMVTPRGYKLA